MYSTLYWITRLDAIHNLFVVVLAICAIACFLGFMFWTSPFAYDDDEQQKNKKSLSTMIKVCIPVAVFGGLVLTFLPTQKEAILIYAGGKTWEYVQSDTSLQKIPYKATEYIRVVLEKEIEEIREESK